MNAPPCPFSATHVIKASLVLGDELKLLWLEHLALNGPDGCYIGAGPMARRLGKSRRAVERGRRELVRLGLLLARPCLRGQTGTYYPTLPASCLPTARPGTDEVGRLTERLDIHIGQIRGATTTMGAARVASPVTFAATGDATRAAPVVVLPGENRAQSTTTGDATFTPPPTSPPTSEVGERQVGEVGARQVGGPVLSDREKAKLDRWRGIADSNLTLDEQQERRALLAREHVGP